MKPVITFLLLLCSMSTVWAQNWSPINTEETFYYNTGGEELTGIRVDSTAVVEGDTVWYTSRNVQFYPDIESGDYCGTETSTGIIRSGFLQSEIVLQENGGFLFQFPDTFQIIPMASIGDQWTFSALSGEETVTAEVVSLEELEVLGEVDSVKTIALSDGRTIQVSKNHGLLAFESSEGENYNLSGIPERQLGNYPIGRYEIFDFEVGDVFVYVENYGGTYEEYDLLLHRIEITNVSEIVNNEFTCTYNRALYHRRWQLMSKFGEILWVEIDPVIGQWEGSAEINLSEAYLYNAVPGAFYSPIDQPSSLQWPPFLDWQEGFFGYHKNVFSDTINTRESKVIGGSWAFSQEIIAVAENFDEGGGFFYSIVPAYDPDVLFQQFDVLPYGDPFDNGPMYDIGDTTVLTYSNIDCSNLTPSVAYADGLGVVSYVVSYDYNAAMTAMVGYRKGDEEFGYVPTASVILSDGDELVGALPVVTVFPVPAVDQLHLSRTDGQSYRIFDISGKPVLQGALLGALNIDVSNLAAGIYNGHLLRDDQPIGQFRFVKR